MLRLREGAAWAAPVAALATLVPLAVAGTGPLVIDAGMGVPARITAGALAAAGAMWPLLRILEKAGPGPLTRHEFEDAVIRFLTGLGYVVFTALMLIPFYVMVMTSLKSQQALLRNPLDFTIDFARGWELFRSYHELVRDFDFAAYMWTSFVVSVLTVAITLLFAIPGAYAVARLRFRGRAALVRSILLIYMVPMIVLALPIYIAFSVTGLRNSLVGIVMIYPVTTIPVALYMLQGYFRGLPAEVEEAGLMDGLRRLAVIWKITLPLSLPALASVSLYVFMIAWNEFLLAFMLLDDPSKFTLTRGVAMLNSSEIPRPAPDGGLGHGHGPGHGAVPRARTLHDQGPRCGLGQGLTGRCTSTIRPGSSSLETTGAGIRSRRPGSIPTSGTGTARSPPGATRPSTSIGPGSSSRPSSPPSGRTGRSPISSFTGRIRGYFPGPEVWATDRKPPDLRNQSAAGRRNPGPAGVRGRPGGGARPSRRPLSEDPRLAPLVEDLSLPVRCRRGDPSMGVRPRQLPGLGHRDGQRRRLGRGYVRPPRQPATSTPSMRPDKLDYDRYLAILPLRARVRLEPGRDRRARALSDGGTPRRPSF